MKGDGLDSPVDWSSPSRCLLLGVAGAGMRALAGILTQAGHQVYGADIMFHDADAAAEAAAFSIGGVNLIPWFPAGALPDFDICVCSPAIPPHAPLRGCMIDQGVRVLPLHQAVGSVFANRSQICVAGTHGKSTTSALLAWILADSGNDASCFVGARYCADGFSDGRNDGGRFGSGSLAVIESCEFENSFLHLQPQHLVLTGIDGDHFDWFSDDAAEDAAFRRLMVRVPRDGRIVLDAGCERSRRVAAEAEVFVAAWVGDHESPFGWSARVVSSTLDQSVVRILAGGQRFADFRFPLSGRHNVRNLTAAVAMAGCLGVSAQQCQDRVAAFPGLRRRMEHRGVCRGMLLLDDYAHHPTAVQATLEAVRQRYSERRIRVIFEPHQIVRLRRLWEEFCDALSLADEVQVLPVLPAREDVASQMCRNMSHALAEEIRASGTSATFVDGVHSAVSTIELTGQPGDLFLTMGAGHAHRIHDEVHRRFQRNTAA